MYNHNHRPMPSSSSLSRRDMVVLSRRAFPSQRTICQAKNADDNDDDDTNMSLSSGGSSDGFFRGIAKRFAKRNDDEDDNSSPPTRTTEEKLEAEKLRRAQKREEVETRRRERRQQRKMQQELQEQKKREQEEAKKKKKRKKKKKEEEEELSAEQQRRRNKPPKTQAELLAELGDKPTTPSEMFESLEKQFLSWTSEVEATTAAAARPTTAQPSEDDSKRIAQLREQMQRRKEQQQRERQERKRQQLEEQQRQQAKRKEALTREREAVKQKQLQALKKKQTYDRQREIMRSMSSSSSSSKSGAVQRYQNDTTAAAASEPRESLNIKSVPQTVLSRFGSNNSTTDGEDDSKNRNEDSSVGFNPIGATQRWVSGLWEKNRFGNEEEWVVVFPTSRLDPGEIVPVNVGGIDLLVVASVDGNQLYCIENSCSHLGTPLETGVMEFRRPNGVVTDDPKQGSQCIVCPLHRTAFELETGRVRGEWCPYPPMLGKLVGNIKNKTPIAVFDIRRRGKNIEVRINSSLEPPKKEDERRKRKPKERKQQQQPTSSSNSTATDKNKNNMS